MVTYPSDWEFRNVGEICHISTGTGDTKDAVPNGLFPFFVRSKKVERINDFEFEGEAVLTAGDGVGTGKVFHYVDGRFKAHQRVYVLNNFQNFDARFFYYYFSSAFLDEVEKYTAKSSVDSVRRPMIANMRIPRPRLPEQRAIAEVLSGFDEHLANLDELIAKKKAIRDGAMKELVSGNSRLGGFGEKWTDISFENMVAPKARIGWQNLRTDEYLDSGYSYIIGGTNFSDGTVDLASCKSVSEERFLMDPAIQVNQGDVLVTKDGTIGKVAVVPRLEKPATLNSGVYVVRPVDGVTRRFLYWVLRSDIFDRFIEDLSAGSTIKHLYQKDLGRFHFRAPKNVPEQEAIAEVMSSFEEDLLVLKEEREKVKRLKLGAMDDLLTGRVRLPLEEEAA